MRGVDVPLHPFVSFLNEGFCAFIVRKIWLCELLTVAFIFLDELRKGIHATVFGLDDFQFELGVHIEIIVDVFLVDNLTVDVVFLVHLHKLTGSDVSVADGYQSLVFPTLCKEKGWGHNC